MPDARPKTWAQGCRWTFRDGRGDRRLSESRREARRVVRSIGLGEVVGREILEAKLKFREQSVFATAYESACRRRFMSPSAPTSFICIPTADGAAIGAATMADFHRLAAVVAELSRGVVINLGSAVVMPEVFLKALNLARNLGRKVDEFHCRRYGFHSALSPAQ